MEEEVEEEEVVKEEIEEEEIVTVFLRLGRSIRPKKR